MKNMVKVEQKIKTESIVKPEVKLVVKSKPTEEVPLNHLLAIIRKGK